MVDTVPDHWRGLLNLAVAQVGLKKTPEAQKNLRKAFKASGRVKARSEQICIGNTAGAASQPCPDTSFSRRPQRSTGLSLCLVCAFEGEHGAGQR